MSRGKLIGTDPTGATIELPLDRRVIAIGSAPDNDIVLNDKRVSAHHAEIVTVERDSFLRDLGSQSGTQVNERRIERHVLYHEDRVRIGRSEFLYQNIDTTLPYPRLTDALDGAPTAHGSATAPTIDGSVSAEAVATESRRGRIEHVATTPLAAALTARLRLLNGPRAGWETPLPKPHTTLGRRNVELATIARRGDDYYLLRATAPQNGAPPTVNGAPVDARPLRLSDGDVIELAGARIRFLQHRPRGRP
jgi:pSer/pThr/pTyr-binding forkhead associated (FHA) protein